jgi:hypothetical protein
MPGRKLRNNNNNTKNDSSSSCKPQPKCKPCESRDLLVQVNPCIELEQQVDTTLRYPWKFLVGEAFCEESPCSEKWSEPEKVCSVLEGSVCVPVKFNLKARLRPKVNIPVTAVTYPPVCAKNKKPKEC